MELSTEEIEQHTEESNGYCKHCDNITQYGLVEPDARGRLCSECGKRTLYGVEWAAIAGLIEVVG